jgi:antitoxin component YwqK of YwqJK toxin-antitoxin module
MAARGTPFLGSSRNRLWFTGAWLALVLAAVSTWVWMRLHPQPKLPELSVVARTNLIYLEGRWYRLSKTNVFTGLMVEYYPSGALCSRTAVSNGLLNGISEGWYTNGQVQIQEHYKDSLADGLRQKWYENGRPKSEALIVRGQVQGTFRSWHENGQLAERIDMKEGKPDGEAWAFYSSGFAKARTDLRAGQVLAQKSWEDGQYQRPGAIADSRLVSKAN